MSQTIQKQIQALRKELRDQFYARGTAIDGILTALLAGEHVLLLGPPGTAKSALAQSVCSAIDGGRFFSWLLTKFSTPEEISGPMSLKALEKDQYKRNTSGKMPEAHVAFLDEIFKANSSILNSLLSMLQERIFYNNGAPTPCPLLSCVGASNELPESAELEALFDRFVFRYWLSYVADRADLKSMLTAPDPQITVKLTLKEIAAAKQEAQAVAFDDAAMETLLDVKAAIERTGIRASDRRWKRAIKTLKCYAWLCGDSAVGEEHFEILPDMLWREPKERPAIVQEVGKIANPLLARATEILDASKEFIANLPSIEVGRAKYLGYCAEANEEMDKMISELRGLIDEKPTRRLQDALEEVQGHHNSMQRAAAKVAGINI